MKTAIVYHSSHHGNTKRLVGGIAKGRPNEADLENARRFFAELCE